MSQQNVIIVGAGLAGISLARQLTGQGHTVTLLEKSRGVGGRCATRRVRSAESSMEVAVDHGLPLLHGRSPEFREMVAAAAASCTLVPDWPLHVQGQGTPCQPQGYDSRSRRWAVQQGVNAVAKHLARELVVQRQTRVTRLEPHGADFVVHVEGAAPQLAPTVVLTCPVPQTLELLQPLAAESEEVQGLVALLRRVAMIPSLVVLAGYERPTASDWHLRLPGPRSIIHSLINDSSKRARDEQDVTTPQVLVIQGTPAFSRRELDGEPERWGDALLEAAAGELGPWVKQPAWRQEHRWRHARVLRGEELSHVVLLSWPGGARLGLCGEAFNPAGGAEGAYLSGLELAGRISADFATKHSTTRR